MKRIPKFSMIRNVSLCRKVSSKFAPLTCQKHSFSVKSSSSLVDMTPKPLALNDIKNPWIEQKDPNGSNQIYYWNPETNETTHLGSPKPRHWLEVKDPNGTELSYWWDPESQVTTPLGASKPSALVIPEANNNVVQPFGIYANQPPQTLGSSMKTMFVWGVGMTLAMTMVRAVIG